MTFLVALLAVFPAFPAALALEPVAAFRDGFLDLFDAGFPAFPGITSSIMRNDRFSRL